VGVALAGVGIYTLGRIIRQSLAPLPPPTPEPQITVKAVAVTHDIALGSVLRSGDVKAVEVPVDIAPAGVVGDIEQVIGRIAKVHMTTGEMVMDHNLADPTNVNHDLGFVIGDNQVLMAFSPGDLMSTLNVLQRGDVVDILVTLTQEVPVAELGEEEDEFVIREGETVTRLLTFDAFQRLEITAMVVDIVKQDENRTPQLPAGEEGEEAPQPTPQPSQVKLRAYLLAMSAQDALLLKHLKDLGANFDLVLRAPTSNQLFQLQTVTSDYIVDRYQLAIPR
jgi:Flp pilus assembly protein CpaB